MIYTPKSHPVLLQRLDERRRLESGQRDDPLPHVDAEVGDDDHAEDVEHGKEADSARLVVSWTINIRSR